jgi:uncharacterized delta-60 repeat protein
LRSVRRIAFVLATAATVAVALLVLGPAAAAPGDLDPTFGADGIVQTDVGSGANDLVLQPDGKIVLVGSPPYGGNMTLARYLPDGSLDQTFGAGGIVVGPPGSANAVALQADGDIVVAGSGENFMFAVARFLPDGSPDLGYGVNGVASGPRGTVEAIAVQPDGDTVAAGNGRETPDSFVLARFNPFGVLDTSFGGYGIVHTEIGYESHANALVLQPDGKIVAAGDSTISPQQTPYMMMALARYQFDGTLDSSFGTNGTSVGPPSPWAFSAGAAGLALQPDGKLVAVGKIASQVAVARFRTDGSLDAAFGTGGVTAPPPGSGFLSEGEDVALQPDGKIVVAGVDYCCGRFAVLRYQPDGNLDRRFGSLGAARGLTEAKGIALQPDGRILAAGGGFAVARYLVTTPSTIAARPLSVEYGRTIRLRGHLTSGRRAPLTILEHRCGAARIRKLETVTAGRNGTWTARVRPRTGTTFWAQVDRERSTPKTVHVSPRLTLKRLSAGTVRARVMFGTSFRREVVTLQRYSGGRWLDFRYQPLKRIAVRSSGVTSVATFHVGRRPGRPLRVVISRDSYGCFAKGLSRAIRG